MKTKRAISVYAAMIITAGTLAGCSGADSAITVISREDGSGTRDAFTELVGISDDDTDNTVETAEISNSTAVVIQSVIGNENAIGYISLGSLCDEVKALGIDGAAATAENINNGAYKVSRPFIIAVREDISEPASDFTEFIMSSDGQAIIEEKGYISVSDKGTYTPSGSGGTIVIAGSTSVAPVMESLADKYKELNSGVTIEIQQTGSSAGITSTIEGACDIGMASREIKDSEIKQGLISTVIAMDGIAVIVNKENDISSMTSEQIKSIYTGEIVDWSEVLYE
ncbi:MAG: substrate-binding domain-containing protein [Oscillospiraceae bacterium]|nr:substrate-binding domain-containing protein [Oscillospiraceae bacterium]